MRDPLDLESRSWAVPLGYAPQQVPPLTAMAYAPFELRLGKLKATRSSSACWLRGYQCKQLCDWACIHHRRHGDFRVTCIAPNRLLQPVKQHAEDHCAFLLPVQHMYRRMRAQSCR